MTHPTLQVLTHLINMGGLKGDMDLDTLVVPLPASPPCIIISPHSATWTPQPKKEIHLGLRVLMLHSDLAPESRKEVLQGTL